MLQPECKTIRVTNRAQGKTRQYDILHQQNFDDMRRDWNLYGLAGPFLETDDWGHEPDSASESWSTSQAPAVSAFKCLKNGGSYYLNDAGDWV